MSCPDLASSIYQSWIKNPFHLVLAGGVGPFTTFHLVRAEQVPDPPFWAGLRIFGLVSIWRCSSPSSLFVCKSSFSSLGFFILFYFLYNLNQ